MAIDFSGKNKPRNYSMSFGTIILLFGTLQENKQIKTNFIKNIYSDAIYDCKNKNLIGKTQMSKDRRWLSKIGHITVEDHCRAIKMSTVWLMLMHENMK